MSTSPEPDFELDLHFLPAWAQKPADQNQYAQYAGRPERDRDESNRDRRGGPARRRDQPSGRGPGGPRQDRPSRGPRPAEARAYAPGGRPDQRHGGRSADPRGESNRNLPPPAPLPDIDCVLVPDDRGVESLARQIKMTGRAYPLFEIAQMVLQKPERHSVTLSVRKNPEGKIVQPLFLCALDDTVWLSEEEAIRHVLDKHFATFYQAEKIQTDPPKGTYTFVAQCGMSGIILGPPNYHDYQNQLRKLHAERFSRMPFDAFKARVRIVKDEAVVKKWIDDQSWKTEYVCLNVPEALKLATRDEVEKHFREVHVPNMIKPVETTHLSGTASRGIRSPALARLIRHSWEEQKRFPLQVATVLSQKFASHGLQFFKVNKTVTHVAVARPHFLDIEAEPVSDGIKKIVQFIDTHPKCTRRKLVEGLAPGSKAPPRPAQAPEATSPSEPAAQAAQPDEPTPEYTAIIGDLHWLIHQGHVMEFATGVLETAKRPTIRPPKPAAAARAQTASTTPQSPTEISGAAQTEQHQPTTMAGAEPGTKSPSPAENSNLEEVVGAAALTEAAPATGSPDDSDHPNP